MKKKLTALILTLVLTITIIPIIYPTTAHAADRTVNGGEFDISTCSLGDRVIIPDGVTATLTGSKNIQIQCGNSVDLTLKDVTINLNGVVNQDAIWFLGGSNKLILEGTNSITGGATSCAVRVEDETILTISGDGILDATSINNAAGIGAKGTYANGAINITRGTILATCSGSYGAGIGSGLNGSLGAINISGGNVTAVGGGSAAGIGHGYNSSSTYSSAIRISGGTVKSTGGSRSAGIGGAYGSSGVYVEISGGEVNAMGGYAGSGIGSGQGGAAMFLIITGGTVFGDNGQYGIDDFGKSTSSSANFSVFTIGADAKVFARNNKFASPISSNIHFSSQTNSYISTNLGVTLPSGWTSAGFYTKGYTVTYDDNGGTGAAVEMVLDGAAYTTRNSSGFSKEGYSFSHWNTKADGTGTSYNAGASITLTASRTLYAIWTPVSSTSLTLSSDKETLATGDKRALAAVISPANTTNTTVTWHSSNTWVATVSTSGVITAKSPGTATITAENGTASDTCAVTVYQPVTSVDIDADSLSLNVSGTGKLNASLLPADAQATPVYWTSSDGTVASVDGTGMVTATGVGTATITATANGQTDTCSVTVAEIPVSTVSLNYGTKSLFVGELFSLSAIVLPSDASDSSVTWESSDDNVATVSSSGLVEAVDAGSCTITATAGGVTDSCVITVSRNLVTSISIDASSKSLYIGEVFALNATVSPSDASDGKVTWDSSDNTVARINSSGIVTAEGIGRCTITAAAGSKTDSCTVTVARERITVESVSLSMGTDATIVMYVGDTMVLTANVSPGNADNASVTWQSSNAAVAGVTSYGKVTAAAEGEATITVSAGDKTDSYKVSVKAVEGAGGEEETGGENEQSPGTGLSTPAPAAPTPTVEVVYTIQVDTTSLPYGAQYIELPNGEVVKLNGEDEISCEVSGSELENGAFKIVALDADRNNLGQVDVSANEGGGIPLVWLIIIAVATLILGAGAMLVVVRAAAVKADKSIKTVR